MTLSDGQVKCKYECFQFVFRFLSEQTYEKQYNFKVDQHTEDLGRQVVPDILEQGSDRSVSQVIPDTLHVEIRAL